jgi:hypothetical protein
MGDENKPGAKDVRENHEPVISNTAIEPEEPVIDTRTTENRVQALIPTIPKDVDIFFADPPVDRQSAAMVPPKTLLYHPPAFAIPKSDKNPLKEEVLNLYKAQAEAGGMQKLQAAIVQGYPVATEHGLRTSTVSFSTRTHFIEVGGRKYFVIYNYPGSQRHRSLDTGCRKAWGDKAFKASEEDWLKVFTRRSQLPVLKVDERTVILPFVQNIGLADLILRFDKERFQDQYSYGQDYETMESKQKLIADVAKSLHELHTKGVTWGEVIPNNLGITPDRKIVFFDPENEYESGTVQVEQRARDVLSWCVSACSGLHYYDGKFNDYRALVNSILQRYGDEKVIKYLQENLCERITTGKTLSHPVAFQHFKARLTLTGKDQYNAIVEAILQHGK